ncbi:MAG: CHAT domain-containing protein [Anaerolineae bacterium]
MDEEKRSLCRIKVSRDMAQITYERSGQRPLNAHANFDHRAALQLNMHPAKTSIQEYGRGLYDLLLLADPRQNVSAVFKRCFDDPSSHVQVSIEIVDETLAQLLDLSWEHLCDPDNRYLAMESRFRFVRRLASLSPGKSQPLDGLPRVLMVISNPSNLESFAIKTLGPDGLQDHSFAPIEAPFLPQQTLGLTDLFDSLKAKGQIAGYRILRGPLPPPHDEHPALLPGCPTLDRIHEVLQAAEEANRPYHIVHFLAHGYLDENGSGHLLLTNEMGDAAPIHQNAFQSLFPQKHQVWLVLFAACQSGSGEQRIGQPLAGLAPTFLRAGIPAVIAMQDEITVRGAAAFTETFYQELTTHGYIDRAVVEARREIERRAPSRGEWVIPVLYLQNEDPRLFSPIVGDHADQERCPELAEGTIANPFYTGGRINDPGLFFGRQRIVREICTELKKGCSISVVGQSQIGKSSLLYYLYKTRADWLPDGAIEFIDLQCVLDEADFCETVLSRLGESGDTLRDLKRTLASREVILLLDEVERLAEEDFNPRLHDLLRSLAQEPHFAMCLATQRPLIEVFPARTPGGVSPFHNIFIVKTLGPFTETETRNYIAARLANTDVTFTDREIERLLAESHCHPAKLQAAAKALFKEKMP